MPVVSDLSAFADAMLETVELPLLALDADLRVEVANPAFYRLFGTTEKETLGRLVYDLGNGQWDIPRLRTLLGEVLSREGLVKDYRVEHTFPQLGRRVMRLNAKRIQRAGHTRSILLAITDETERERLQAELKGRIEFSDKILDSVREALLILDENLRVHSANQIFYDMFRVSPAETTGRLVYELGNGQWQIKDLRDLLEDILPRQRSFDDYEVRHTFQTIGTRVMLLNGRRLDHLDLIVLAIRDITKLRALEQTRSERDRRQTFLLKLNDAIRPLADSVSVQAAACEHLGRHLSVGQVAYAAIDASQSWAVISEDWNDGSIPSNAGRHRLVDFGEAFIADLTSGRTVVIADVAKDARTNSAEALRSFRNRSISAFINVPLLKAGQLAAVLALHAREPRSWQSWDISLAEEVAERTWSAVERAHSEAALRESEAKAREQARELEIVYGTARIGLCVFDRELRYRRINARLAEINGLPAADHIGKTVREVVPALADTVEPIARGVLETGEPVMDVELTGETEQQPGVERTWLEQWLPLRDHANNVTGINVVVEEITDRKRAEHKLRAAHDTLRQLVDRSPFGIYLVDADFRLVQVSDGARQVFENVEPVIGRDFAEVLRKIWPEPFATEAIERFRHTLSTGEAYHDPGTMERRADSGVVQAYDWRIERLTLADGRPGVVCHFYDLSERRRHEEQIRLLMREVNHRSKNLLGLVQAIARQTATTSPDDFLKRLDDRIHSLGAAQDLLIKNQWKSVPLADLVQAQLSHFADLLGSRVVCSGPPVLLKPQSAQALGMALHELATNAAKYGALSNGSGCVEVTWGFEPGRGRRTAFTMRWLESGGPPVEKPTRTGFGSFVMTGAVRMSLGGSVALDYGPEGLRWRLTCDAGNVVEGGARGLDAQAETPARKSDAAKRLLVVEDEPVLASEIASNLREAGFEVVGTAGSVGAALDLIEKHGCDGAVLDVNLRDETSEAIAEKLTAGGMPFVVVTGYSSAQVPKAMRSAPLLTKPLRGASLQAVILRLIGT